MPETTTIAVTTDQRDELDDMKAEHESFRHVVARLLEAGADAPADGDGADIERLEASLATIEERTGRIEKQIDDLGGGRR